MDTPIHRKINVLEMHSSLGYAGGQRNMMTIVTHLDKSRFNVFVAGYMEGGHYEEVLKAKQIQYIVSSNIEDIKQFIRKHSIDVLHIHRSGQAVPVEDKIIFEAKKINPDITIIEKNVFGKYDSVCDSLIDCSCFQSMMHLNERYLPASKETFDFDRMKVVYNMVNTQDFERYRMTQKEMSEYKKTLGIGEDDFVVGRIGRPHVAKWSDLILDMMPYVVKLIPNIKLVLMGVPKSRIKRIKKSTFASHVVILSDTSDQKKVHTFYQIINVLAHTSKIGECNGNTINEAMFWEKPVITHSTPHRDNGQLEQVIHMQNGIIANYPQTFSRALKYLFEHPKIREKMGKRGMQKIQKDNNIAVVVSQLEKLFVENLIRKGALSKDMQEAYKDVAYLPSKAEIEAYREEYRRRLEQEFGILSLLEKLINLTRFPKHMWWKARDFIQDKFL